MEQSFRTQGLPVAISYGLTHDPQLLEPCLCNKQHLESRLNLHLSFQLLQDSSKTLPSANTEETFPSKEGHNQWPLSLWACQKCHQDWHEGKSFPLTLKWHCWHLNLMALFSPMPTMWQQPRNHFQRKVVLLIWEETLFERFATNILPCHRHPTSRWVIIHRLFPPAWHWYQ